METIAEKMVKTEFYCYGTHKFYVKKYNINSKSVIDELRIHVLTSEKVVLQVEKVD